jgi:CheY-like chemotaxis protein
MHSILLVDDEPDIVAALSIILEQDGYEVRCAGNGIQALACLATETIDVIVTDWMMPEMGGVELCARLKATPELATVPILVHTSALLTGKGETTSYDAYLRKPAPTELFLATVAGLCKKIR